MLFSCLPHVPFVAQYLSLYYIVILHFDKSDYILMIKMMVKGIVMGLGVGLGLLFLETSSGGR